MSTIEYLNVFEAKRQIYDWLHPVDPSTDYASARKLSQIQPAVDTVQSDQYQAWEGSPGPAIYIVGPAGTGKTASAAAVLGRLFREGQDQSRVAFFFCDFADSRKNTLDAVVRALLWQICVGEQNDSLVLLKALRLRGSCPRPSTQQLCALLSDTIGHSAPMCILIDGLDECDMTSGVARTDILAWVLSLVEHPAAPRLFVTSRPDHDIEESVKSWAGAGQIRVLGHTSPKAMLGSWELVSDASSTPHDCIKVSRWPLGRGLLRFLDRQP